MEARINNKYMVEVSTKLERMRQYDWNQQTQHSIKNTFSFHNELIFMNSTEIL